MLKQVQQDVNWSYDVDSFIALVDCDSFFVSCEQAIDPSLQNKAVCVISGERGCVLARSKEAKSMGVPMGHPYFMAKKDFPDCIYVNVKHGLYGEFSRNVMRILRDFSPLVEVYSVDEAFVDLSGLKKMYKTNYLGIVKLIREKIKSELGINVSIGVSSSKVLAKLACEKAKNNLKPEGIYLIGKRKIPKELKATKIQEIWGVGKKTTLLLNRWGVLYCEELVEKPDEWLKLKIGKRGIELKHELLGEYLDKVKSTKKLPKSIQNTRSFEEFTTDLNYIKNALNIHIHNSCTRLRRYKGKCISISVMLKTKDFQTFWEKKQLEELTNFELEISKVAMELLEKMYSPNLIYRSCGVLLENLNYNEEDQLSLFAAEKRKNFDKLGQSIDKLEAKFGRNIVKTGFVKD